MKTWARHLSVLSLAVFSALWFSGCLSTEYAALLKYDEAKDEFTVLNVYQRIAAATPGDAEYLYQLWRNRDHIIRLPNIDIFGKPAILRFSPTQYDQINLGQAPNALEPRPSAIPLDQIRVLPGTFFLRGSDMLCYYDQVVVPGKVVDQSLALFLQTIAPELTEAIDKETKRRQDGGQRLAWDQVRRKILESFHPSGKPADDDKENSESGNPLHVLDEQSLQLLRGGIADGNLRLRREKQVFRISVPLSDADARQYDEIWRTMAEAVRTDALHGSGKDPASARIASKLLLGIELSVHPRSVEFKIDLAIIAKHLPEILGTTKPLSEPTPENSKKMTEMIAGLRAKGATIDEKLTLEEVINGFAAGSLKSLPPAHSVEPGTGMIQAPPPAPAGAVKPAEK
jgi:hypothetical protein